MSAATAPLSRGVHHLALCTDDVRATVDFYVDVLKAAARAGLASLPGATPGWIEGRLAALPD